MALETVTYVFPGPDRAGDIARVHVASWREAYAGIVPDPVLANLDETDRAASWRSYLELPDFFTVLAEAGGAPVGFIHTGPLSEPLVEGANGHIYTLYILNRHHRRGIGRRFLGMSARHLLGQGGRALSVCVLTKSEGARAFYEAMGAHFVRPSTVIWDGHTIDESIYLFENLPELALFA